MQKGGYQIIDLENWKFTTTKGSPVAKTQKGVYALVKGTRKVIMLSGINLDGKELHDIFIEVKLNTTTYEATIYSNYKLTITNTDVVTIEALK